MLSLFKRHKSNNKIVKLYALNVSSEDREQIVVCVLNTFDELFCEQLNEFDIHGPYGISKGKTVGHKAFISKLQKKGHSKYSSLNGNFGEEFGFHINYLVDEYTLELIVWYREDLHEINLFDLISSISNGINIQYGFVLSLPSDYCVNWESKVKNSFGSLSVSTNPEVQSWESKTQAIQQGQIRGLYPVNIINKSQAKHFNASQFKTTPLSSNLYYVQQIN